MDKILSIENSQQLKGFAISLVIIGHLNLFLNFWPAAKRAGAWGVAIFLLLSGYGLIQSYLKNGLNNFFSKRFLKVLVPYSLVTLLWLLIDTLFLQKSYGWETIFLSLIGLDLNRTIDSSMWYITFILLWYLIFYLVFRLGFNNFLKLCLLFIFSLVFKYYSDHELTQKAVYGWQLHAFLFPIGAMLGLYMNKVLVLVNKVKYYMLFVSFTSFYLFTIYVGQSTKGMNLYSWSNLLFAIGTICLFYVLKSYGFKSKILMFIGSISFELYLFEWVFITKYKILKISDNLSLTISLYAIVIITLSIGLQKMINLLKTSNKDKIKVNHNLDF